MGGAEQKLPGTPWSAPFFSPQDTKLKTMNGEAPTVDLSFQLLSSEVRLQIRGKSGPGNHVPPPVDPQWLPTSFTVAGLIQGWARASGRRELLLCMELSEGDLRLQKTRKRELRLERAKLEQRATQTWE